MALSVAEGDSGSDQLSFTKKLDCCGIAMTPENSRKTAAFGLVRTAAFH
jgi:hypothetical protein